MTTIPKIEIKKSRKIIAADFWCGAGGTSTGLVHAVKDLGYELEQTAVNHWDIAVATHSKNHPNARHYCKAVDSINPLDIYAGRRLQLLVASPECVHHSRARGGKPRDEQKRADAWDLQRWIEKLYIENLLIENVREFVDWGPLKADGTPDKRHKGKYFNQFIDFLKILYNVEWRVLNCADYGDATTRERFFLIARRPKGKKIFFPEPTHASRKVLAKKQPSLFGGKELKPWRSAREIIDWNLPGKSVFGRKKPLSENTMKRIFAGLFKYSLKPFVMGTGGPTGQQRPRSVDEPVRTILTDGRQNLFVPYLINLKGKKRSDRSTDEPSFAQCAGGNHQMLVEPFMVNLENGSNRPESMSRDIQEPIPTICGKGILGVVEPFLVKYHGNENGAHLIAEPISTITTKDRLVLIEPFLVQFFGGATAKSVDDPIPTITANYEHYGLAEPYLISFHSGQKDGGVNRSREVNEPVPTLDTSNRFGVVEPFIIPCNHGTGDTRSHSIDDPMKTITGVDAWAMVEPFLVKFKNNQDGQSIDDPLKTLTTKESYGLCIPQIGAILDIRFRMLQPHELAAAMSFPKDYYFHGTRDQQVKQIGNTVPVKTAQALCRAILEN